MQPENIRAGVYQHYKGPMYLVLGVAHDSNADTLHSGPPHMHCKPLEERFVVVYVALNNDKSGRRGLLCEGLYQSRASSLRRTSRRRASL
jgi:hypothetical protein